MPDSGFFLTNYYSPIVDKKVIRERAAALMGIINQYDDFSMQGCLKDFDNDMLSCFDSENVVKYIKPPMLIIESQYDAWSMENIMIVPCMTNLIPPLSI